MIDWDAYRAAYPTMTYNDVAAFHRQVWERYPDQGYHSPAHLRHFFDDRLSGWPVRVLEVGGWRGEAAATILADHPSIVTWTNYELCEGAVKSSVVKDPRYRGIFPDRWPWEIDAGSHDIAVLAHVIEHMTAAQLGRLVGWLADNGVRYVYVEAPLRDKPRAWKRSSSAHLLEIGWTGVIGLFARSGYVLRERHAYPPDRHVLCFEAGA